jgi:hypothetical protein
MVLEKALSLGENFYDKFRVGWELNLRPSAYKEERYPANYS